MFGSTYKVATTEEVALPINDNITYPIDSNSNVTMSELSQTLKSTIMIAENVSEENFETEVKLYKVDFNKINAKANKEYIINILSGKLYSIQYQKYNGKFYHTPELGVNKNGDIIEEDKKTLTIHYLPGYDTGTEYKQVVNIDDKTITLNELEDIGFDNNGYTFMNWKDVTENNIDKSILIDEGENEEDTTESNGEENDEEVDEEITTYENGEEITLEGEDIYLQAQWSSYSVKLHCNGGNINDEDNITYAVLDGQPYGDLPDPVKDGYVFGGWHKNNEDFSNENQIVGDDIYMANDENQVTDLYAYWKNINIATITYNVDSSLGETCTKSSKQVIIGKKIGSLPTSKYTKKVNQNGKYNFDCWTTTKKDKTTKVSKNTVVNGDMNIYALYTIHINFDYQGGTVNKRYRKTERAYKNVKIGGIRGYLYTYAKKTGVKGNGWWTEPDGNGIRAWHKTKITQTEDFTLYADWLDPCIITYNLNYDTTDATPTSKILSQKSKYGALANVTREGYKFEGWYTASENGTKINNNDIILKDIILYAHWSESSWIVTLKNDDGSIISQKRIEWNDSTNKTAIYIIPKCDLETENKVFKYWELNGQNYTEGNSYIVNNNVTFNAVYYREGGIINAESIIKATEKVNQSGYYEFLVNEIKYPVHVYFYDGDQIWRSDLKPFGDETDVANENFDAKRMIIVKVKGSLTVESDSIVTAYASQGGYGGPKGMFLYVTGTLTNKGKISMTAKGARAGGENVYLWKNKNYDIKENEYEFIPYLGGTGGAGVKASRGTTKNGKGGVNGSMRSTRRRRFWTM